MNLLMKIELVLIAKNISQSGCGDWHTDYWGFAGKELVKKIDFNEHKTIYFVNHIILTVFFSLWTVLGP